MSFLKEIAVDILTLWHLRRASRCARCDYRAPKRLRPFGLGMGGFYVDCMGCEVRGKPGSTRKEAVRNWNTENRIHRSAP